MVMTIKNNCYPNHHSKYNLTYPKPSDPNNTKPNPNANCN